MSEYDDVLVFWFGFDARGPIPEERLKFWFGGSPETDERIRDRFGGRVGKASRGELSHWEEEPCGRLALILLLDQFTRNIYRGTPQAYALDSRALQLSLDGLARGHDQALEPIERAFFYLPLEHAEDLSAQQRSVHLFESLIEDVAEVQRPAIESFADYARRHCDIIARFGRFPHRNSTLGRPSTDKEAAFLRQPGSSF